MIGGCHRNIINNNYYIRYRQFQSKLDHYEKNDKPL